MAIADGLTIRAELLVAQSYLAQQQHYVQTSRGLSVLYRLFSVVSFSVLFVAKDLRSTVILNYRFDYD